MRQLAIFAVLFLLVAGCPQQEEQFEYSVDSLAVEGSEHTFSGKYEIFVELSENSFQEGNTLMLFDGSTRVFEQNITAEIPDGSKVSFEWLAQDVGSHAFRAAVHNSSDVQVSTERTLNITVRPLGFYDFEDDELNHPVEAGVWCAQEFTLENAVQVQEAQLQLRSLVPTQKGTLVELEIRESANGLPGEGGEAILASASMQAIEVGQKPAWHPFEFEKKIEAGTYWLLLKRDHSLGNVAWTYANGENANGAYCRDLAVSEEWFPIEGSFAFKLQ